MSVTNRPQIEAYIGASGSGKGVSINRRLAELQPARLVIWDPRNEYGKHARPVSDLATLCRDLRLAGGGPIRVRFVPGAAVKTADAFATVCNAVFAAAKCVFVAEELSDVTSPSFAPPAWRRITTQGRHAGLHVIGAAQRPTLIDKTFLGNCTQVRVFQLGYDDDMKAMSKEVRAPFDALAGLVTEDLDGGGADIRALEYERRTRTLTAIRIRVTTGGQVTERRAPFVAAAPQKRPRSRAAEQGAT